MSLRREATSLALLFVPCSLIAGYLAFPALPVEVPECFPEHSDLASGTSTEGGDVILGGSAAERLCGQGGDDLLQAGRGDDWLRGNDGDDRLRGEAGEDHLWGDGGHDFLRGGPGKDRLLGGPGDDVLEGGPDDDDLAGEWGRDRLLGEEGDDVLTGGPGADEIWGGPGNDRLAGGPAADVYFYRRGDGNDVLFDREGENRLVLYRVSPSQVSEHREGSDLVLTLAGTEGSGDGRGQNDREGGATLTLRDHFLPCEGCSLSIHYDDRPNIVLIEVPGDALAPGSELAAAATTGLSFTHFYTGAPHDLSARASLLTGRHSGHGRLRLPGPLAPDASLLPRLLEASGYATALFGEWGLGTFDPAGLPTATPDQAGFGAFAGSLTGWEDLTHPAASRSLYELREGRTETLAAGPGIFAERARTFLEEHRNQPFFLYLPWTSTSAAPPHVGEEVTALRRHLAELGLGARTLVLLAGTGSSAGRPANTEGSLLEREIRVPLIAWWPGTIRAGTIDEPAALWDLHPTLAELAELPVQAEADGISLLWHLRRSPGASCAAADRPLYWETFHPRADYRQAARLGRYKALRRVQDGHLELYDLEADPAERRNLAEEPSYCRIALALTEVLNTSRTTPAINPGGRFDIPPLPRVCPRDPDEAGAESSLAYVTNRVPPDAFSGWNPFL